MLGWLHVYLCQNAHKFEENQTGEGSGKGGVKEAAR